MRHVLTAALIVGGLSVASQAQAGPLDVAACNALTSEIQVLEGQGLKALYEKGPAAAKANATREQMERIRRYMDLLGQSRFRCTSETPYVTLRPEPVEDPAETAALNAPIEAGSPGVTLPAGTEALVASGRPKRPAQPKATPTAAAAGTAKAAPASPLTAAGETPRPKPAPVKSVPKPAPDGATPAPKPKSAVAAQAGAPPAPPKPKPKPDDAFRPAAPGASSQ
jgi:hypothetical protein